MPEWLLWLGVGWGLVSVLFAWAWSRFQRAQR
jgi:hypothetical protein